MTFRRFPYNFHDGQLMDFSLGPRQEAGLSIALDPVWNDGQSRMVRVRFGAIQNFHEVEAFLGKIKKPTDPDRSAAEVIGLVHSGSKKDRVLLDLEGYGSIEIQSRHLTIV